MTKINSQIILDKAIILFSRTGMDYFSIRKLADLVGISPSVIYHYFRDQDILLQTMFHHLNHTLGFKRAVLPKKKTASEMLKQRIEFQIDNQEAVVAVLKYYLSHRETFPKFKNGFVPDKSALHIEEVLEFGRQTGEFQVENLEDDAKVIAHAINGFLLEYFPYQPSGKEKKQLVERIHNFLIRALKKGGEENESN